MRRLAALLGAVVVLSFGCTSASSVATCTVLNIPPQLSANYTAPAGAYCPGPTSTTHGTITADLSAAQITGSGTGYLFKPAAGSNLTVKLGAVSNMAGIVTGQVGAGGRAQVTLLGGTLTNVVSGVLYKANDGGRLDATLTGTHATGMGAGIRTYGSAQAYDCDLGGGGNPSSGDPGGIRGLDLNTTGTPVPDQVVIVQRCNVHGFTGGNTDGASAEESVSYFGVSDSTFANFGDAGADSKALVAVITRNTFACPCGLRLVASHIGRLYSTSNTYSVQAGAAGLQASSGYGPDPTHPNDPGLTSLGDTFTLTGTALVAKAEVQCAGSTGFTSPRAGVIRLIGDTWTPAGGTPWFAPHSVCAVDGIDYHPSVTNG